MTSTLERTKKTTPAGEAPSERFRLPGPSRTRRPLTAVASAAVVFASIAVFASIYSGAGHQTSVLIVTATIEKGQLISGSDLGQSSVSTSGGITPIPVSSAPELSGRRAAVTIPAGSLLTSGDLTTAQPIATGDAVVGLALKAGQLPSSGVVPGDQVMIVETASPGAPLTAAPVTAVPSTAVPSTDGSAAATTTGVLVPQASVFDVESPSADSAAGVSELVSVEVSSTLAAAVSTAAAADQVSLVLLPDDLGSLSGAGS